MPQIIFKGVISQKKEFLVQGFTSFFWVGVNRP